MKVRNIIWCSSRLSHVSHENSSDENMWRLATLEIGEDGRHLGGFMHTEHLFIKSCFEKVINILDDPTMYSKNTKERSKLVQAQCPVGLIKGLNTIADSDVELPKGIGGLGMSVLQKSSPQG